MLIKDIYKTIVSNIDVFFIVLDKEGHIMEY